MDQQELKEVLRKHLLWLSDESGGEKANLYRANLLEATLQSADLQSADLRGADLSEADLRGADLRGADLYGANLSEADLRGADLRFTNMRWSKLIRANLGGAIMSRGVDLTGADLTRANLSGADLTEADLIDTDLTEADLKETNLTGADIRDSILNWADLHRANLSGADLSGSSIIEADLSEANLSNAGLVETNLSTSDLRDSNLQYANFRNANLQDADLEGANTEGADFRGTLFENVETTPETAYGQKRSGVKALKKVVEPIKVAAFKRTFPEAFETVKHDIGGGTLTPEAATALIERYGMTWQISTTKWKSKLQRISPKPNDVLQLNIDLKAVTDEEKLLKNIEAIRQVSFRSQHPALRSGPMTIGWVRYSSFDTAILVEEVQSDLPTVRKGISDAEFQRQLVAKGLSDSDIKQALDVLQPFVDRFYFDALALVLDIAAEAGLPVEMLSKLHKIEQGLGEKKANVLYEDLPRKMGMRKADSKLGFITGKTWQISPNPVRRGRVRIPKTWSRKN